jgi:hypothetical protein
MKKTIAAVLIGTVLAVGALATPSTQLWNPSTDIQGPGSWHIGIDDYFTVIPVSEGGYQFPTDLGLTYGVLPGLEIGVDVFLPQKSPVVMNMKYGIAESENLPALAVGGFGFGTEKDVTDQNVIYAVAAKTLPVIGRFSAGYFFGNEKLLVDPATGIKDNAGIILTWDKAVTDKLWLCVDYAGTKSLLGSTFYGLSWMFLGNTSVIVAMGTFNNGAKPVLTTQLDINI